MATTERHKSKVRFNEMIFDRNVLYKNNYYYLFYYPLSARDVHVTDPCPLQLLVVTRGGGSTRSHIWSARGIQQRFTASQSQFDCGGVQRQPGEAIRVGRS